METRLMVGSRHPDTIEKRSVPIDNYESTEETDGITVDKRKLEMPLTEACPSVTEWLSINKSRDIHDQEVEIFQPTGSEEDAQLGAQVGRDGQVTEQTHRVPS